MMHSFIAQVEDKVAAEPFQLRFDALFQDQGIPLAIMGMVVVFMALVVLLIIISTLPRVIELLEGSPAQRRRSHPDVAGVGKQLKSKTAGPTPVAAPAPTPARGLALAGADVPTSDEISPEILAVIAAAVYEMEDSPVRIVRTRPLTVSELAWTLEGRIRHHASHRLPRRN